MPFSGYITGYIVFMFFMIRLWYQFPLHLRINPNFRKRLQAQFCYFLWLSVLVLQVMVLSKVFTIIRIDLQWIMAFVLPLVREFNDRVMNTLICKAAGFQDIAAKFIMKMHLNCSYALFIVIMLGSSATENTSYYILGVDFAINLYLALKIIRLGNNYFPTIPINPNNLELENIRIRKEEILMELVLYETIEVIVPLSYMCTFTMAYYGPNADILGNVGNNYWHYRKVCKGTETHRSNC